MARAGEGSVVHHRPRDRKLRGSGQDPLPLAHLAQFRAVTYRLFSHIFLYPHGERLLAVAAAARELQEQGAVLARFAFFEQWQQLLHQLQGLGERDAGELQGKFVSLFSVNAGGDLPCPPYESTYRVPAGQPTGWLLAQVEQEYTAAGLTLSPSLGELPDHLAVEMEFVASLCGQEAQAWEERDLVHGIAALQRQKAFLDRHLARWLPDFTWRVMAADGKGLFAAVSRGAQSFISYDCDFLDALVAMLIATAKGA